MKCNYRDFNAMPKIPAFYCKHSLISETLIFPIFRHHSKPEPLHTSFVVVHLFFDCLVYNSPGFIV